MKTGTKKRTKNWRDSNIGWQGFFNGYTQAEKDKINRSRDRLEYIVENLKAKLKRGAPNDEMLEFLERIKFNHE
jgi:hypothetical protein